MMFASHGSRGSRCHGRTGLPCPREGGAAGSNGGIHRAGLSKFHHEAVPAVQIPCPVSFNHGFDYWQQLPDGRIALGGGRDRAMDREAETSTGQAGADAC